MEKGISVGLMNTEVKDRRKERVKILWRIPYYLIIVPAGFVSKIFNRDRLDLTFDKNRASYRNIAKSPDNKDEDPESEDTCPDTMYPMW